MPIKKANPIKLRKWDEGELESFEISADLYTHLVITEALKAVPKGLESGNANSGLIALSISVDQLEQILRSRTLLEDGDDYYVEVEKKTESLKDEKLDAVFFQGRLANFKLGLLLKIVFGTTTKSKELVM